MLVGAMFKEFGVVHKSKSKEAARRDSHETGELSDLLATVGLFYIGLLLLGIVLMTLAEKEGSDQVFNRPSAPLTAALPFLRP
jgi:hypothetical protein